MDAPLLECAAAPLGLVKWHAASLALEAVKGSLTIAPRPCIPHQRLGGLPTDPQKACRGTADGVSLTIASSDKSPPDQVGLAGDG